MLEYKAKLDEEKENRPYCNHQEFGLKTLILFQKSIFSSDRFFTDKMHDKMIYAFNMI